MLLTTK